MGKLARYRLPPFGARIARAPEHAADRHCERVLNRPSVQEPVANCALWDAAKRAPLIEVPRCAVQREKARATSVLCLLCHRRPPAVRRLVVSVYVDALNGVPRRGHSPHVCDEVFEGLPPFANRDASPAVVWPRHVVRVATPSAHLHPRLVLGRLRHPVRTGGAAAGHNLAAVPDETLPRQNLLSAAVAAKEPRCLSSRVCPNPVDRSQAAKLLSRDVDCRSTHYATLTINRECATLEAAWAA